MSVTLVVLGSMVGGSLVGCLMTWNPYRIVRRWLRDPDYFQACAYTFAFALGVVMLTVGPIILGADR